MPIFCSTKQSLLIGRVLGGIKNISSEDLNAMSISLAYWFAINYQDFWPESFTKS